jgi:hypothetical protein
MTSTERRVREPAVSPRFQAVDRPEELTHLVCCRDHSWERALCGAEPLLHINLGAQFICTMCVEVCQAALAAHPRSEDDNDVCPIDGRACPEDEELDDLIRRRLEP